MNGRCDERGCKERSTVRPRLLFFPPGVLSFGMLAQEFCAAHGAALRVDDFITDERWSRICVSFDQCGKRRPLRDLVQLKLETVLHAEDN